MQYCCYYYYSYSYYTWGDARGAWRFGQSDRWCWRFAVGDLCARTHTQTYKACEKVCVCVCMCDGGVVLNGVAAAAGQLHSHRCIPLGLAPIVFKRRWPAAAVHVHLPHGIYLSVRPPTPRRACPWSAPRMAHRTPETCILLLLCFRYFIRRDIYFFKKIFNKFYYKFMIRF